jgi:hypothetical protein
MSHAPLRTILAVTVALLFAAACRKPAPPDVQLGDAMQSGQVTAGIRTDGDDGSSATVTLTRVDAKAPLRVIVPAGVVLYAGASGLQRLITGQAAVLVFAAGETNASQTIVTYCIDQFALTPAAQVALSITPTGGPGMTREETEPLHQLADCMAQSSQSQADKQLAVWAVSGDLLHKTRDQALGTLTQSYIDDLSEQRRGRIETQGKTLQASNPLVSDERLKVLLDQEMDEAMPEIRRQAADKAKLQLDRLLADDKDLLSRCGYPASSTLLFA